MKIFFKKCVNIFSENSEAGSRSSSYPYNVSARKANQVSVFYSLYIVVRNCDRIADQESNAALAAWTALSISTAVDNGTVNYSQ